MRHRGPKTLDFPQQFQLFRKNWEVFFETPVFHFKPSEVSFTGIMCLGSQDSGIPEFWDPRILGSQNSGIPESWDPRILGSPEFWDPRILGIPELQDSQNSGNPKILGFLELWESQNSRIPRILGIQEFWGCRNSGDPRHMITLKLTSDGLK